MISTLSSSNLSLAQRLANMATNERTEWLNSLTEREVAELNHNWEFWGRPDQHAPKGDWFTWMIMAGRGWGKTRTGAEWIRKMANENPGCRIALVGETAADCRDVMIKGDSGLIACDPSLT